MEQKEIFQKLALVISDQLKIDKSSVTLESSLENLGADSLDRVEIIMKIEEQFDIEINDEDAEKIETINDVVNYIFQSTNK